MSDLPIHNILWAPSNKDHYNHLHVEGAPKKTGTPPQSNPGMSSSVQIIYEALRQEFGTPYYFQDPKPAEPCWSHMGWYNRRKISGSNTWSQHAWSNALDIGPYYGQAEQQKFYDFLTGSGDVPWKKPGDPVESVADAKAVHAWQGNDVMSAADLDYDENDPKLLDERYKIVTARIVDLLMR